MAGLHDQPKGRRRPVLDEAEAVALKQLVLAGPDLVRHGRMEWTPPSLAEEIAQRWGKRLHPASLSRVLRRLGLSKQKTRPRHPQADAEAKPTGACLGKENAQSGYEVEIRADAVARGDKE